MIKIIELFAGIGSQHSALKRLGIDFEIVGIAEIDKYAIKSYEAIHGKANNFGDISQIEKLPRADFWTYSFPCQDLSVAGKQRGIKEGTRSGLLYQVERLLEVSKEHNELPKYLMLENVKNLVGKKFKRDFDKWLGKLDQLGYNTYWKVLNAKNYGVPQNRDRVFAISIRKDIDKGYQFPNSFDNGLRLKDILQDDVEEKFYISNEKLEKLFINIKERTPGILYDQGTRFEEKDISVTICARDYKGFGNQGMTGVIEPKILVPQATAKGYIECSVPGVFDMTYPDSKTRRGRVQDHGDIVPTLTAASQDIMYADSQYRIRKLTPLETFRLMGFKDEEFYKAQAVNSNSQLYKQAGNSIVVDVLYYLFKNLLLESDGEEYYQQLRIGG